MNINEIFITKDIFNFIKPEAININARLITLRGNNKIVFLEVNDGTSFHNLQIVCKPDKLNNFADIIKLKRNSILKISGILIATPKKTQKFELLATELNIKITPLADSPLQKKEHSFEYLRTIAHLRPGTKLFFIITKIKSFIYLKIHEFFKEREFTYIQTPIITSNDAEAAGESFTVTTINNNQYHKDFFGKKVSLTVSGQLHAESYAQMLKKVYTFGPTFRAENSNTIRHAAEFWMLEPEFIYADLNKNMDLIQDLMVFIVQNYLKQFSEKIKYLDKILKTNIRETLTCILDNNFIRITYEKAITILQNANQNFEQNKIKFGIDLQTEHERYLCEKYFKKPCFIYNYPKDIKAFYMKQNDDQKTVAACDLLVPGVGELVGGSQREDNYLKILNRCKELNININSLKWYLDLRKYGYVTSSGFGLGFERLIMYLTGIKNIRDVLLFPATTKNLNF